MEIIASAPLEMERVRRHEPARHSRGAQSLPGALRGRAGAPPGLVWGNLIPCSPKEGASYLHQPKAWKFGLPAVPSPLLPPHRDRSGCPDPRPRLWCPAPKKNPWDTGEVANSHRRVPEPTGHDSSKVGREIPNPSPRSLGAGPREVGDASTILRALMSMWDRRPKTACTEHPTVALGTRLGRRARHRCHPPALAAPPAPLGAKPGWNWRGVPKEHHPFRSSLSSPVGASCNDSRQKLAGTPWAEPGDCPLPTPQAAGGLQGRSPTAAPSWFPSPAPSERTVPGLAAGTPPATRPGEQQSHGATLCHLWGDRAQRGDRAHGGDKARGVTQAERWHRAAAAA